MTKRDSTPGASLAKEVPYLRRYVRALTGSQDEGDHYARAALEALIADPAFPDAAVRPRVALFRAFHGIWARGEQRSGTPRNALEAKAQNRLRALTPGAREAVLLGAMEGFSPAEVGGILGREANDAASLIALGMAEIARGVAGRVLIIEDEPLIAADIAGVVGDAGHSVIDIAATRGQALRIAGRERPDLLLADVQLADGSSGVDAARDILALWPGTPLVFITAYLERMLDGARPEPSFLIAKPFTQAQLKLVIGHAMFFSTTAGLTASP